MKIFSSASKLVFLIIAITVCASFYMGKLDPKDFMLLAGMSFTFYFSNKGEANNTDVPFAGK